MNVHNNVVQIYRVNVILEPVFIRSDTVGPDACINILGYHFVMFKDNSVAATIGCQAELELS